ncbi:uncharacterized protein LOC129753375 [Uranotaenia lowii]|uniref:uncharacterized protein LOC129753375 n=1 Tax=Uranotaenia lowii TaxID=190385 RepID=UPI00247835B9|nr:uncharacterized protein LOC129753375 [Uranotaenia lowii]
MFFFQNLLKIIRVNNMSDDRVCPEFVGPKSSSASARKRSYDFQFSLPGPELDSPSSSDDKSRLLPLLQPMDVDLDETEIRHRNRQFTSKKQKLNNGTFKRKIRKLVNEDRKSENQRSSSGWRNIFRLRNLSIGSIVVTLVVLMAFGMKEDFRNDFFKLYLRQYYSLLYGVEDYCSQGLDFSNVTTALKQRVVGQSVAIDRVTNFFNENRNQIFSSAALLGPSGVGKSLMARVIAENFQWHTNVHLYDWDRSTTIEKHYLVFHSFIDEIWNRVGKEGSCGRHLLVIDRLPSDNLSLVDHIHHLINYTARQNKLPITVLFVFQDFSFTGYERFSDLSTSIEKIFLEHLAQENLFECIRLELEEMDANFDDCSMEDLLASIDVHRLGCKPVRAKMGLYCYA